MGEGNALRRLENLWLRKHLRAISSVAALRVARTNFVRLNERCVDNIRGVDSNAISAAQKNSQFGRFHR